MELKIPIPRFLREPKKTILIVKQGSIGIECFFDAELLKKLHSPYKKQLIAFIDEVKKGLGEE